MPQVLIVPIEITRSPRPQATSRAIGWVVRDGERARCFTTVQRMTRLAQSGRANRTRECQLLDQSGQMWILARDGLSANDPKRALAVHCGNGFDARLSPYRSTSIEPIRCCRLSFVANDETARVHHPIGGADGPAAPPNVIPGPRGNQHAKDHLGIYRPWSVRRFRPAAITGSCPK